MSNSEKYIFEQGEERERTAIVRLIADRSPSSNVFHEQLNLSLPWCWMGIRIPQRLLLKGLDIAKDDFLGDIDFICGNLEPVSQELFQKYVEQFSDKEAHPSSAYTLASVEILDRSEIKWIPSLDFIVASECKASFLNSDGILKAGKFKGQNKHRGQARELCDLGFNKVALIKFVVTEPIISRELHPWSEAGMRASFAQNIIEKETFVKEDDLFGTLVLSIGAVAGGVENHRGSESYTVIKNCPLNSVSEKKQLFRKTIEENLSKTMCEFPIPRQVPVLILCCSNPKCLFLYVSEANPYEHCPKCNWKPR